MKSEYFDRNHHQGRNMPINKELKIKSSTKKDRDISFMINKYRGPYMQLKCNTITKRVNIFTSQILKNLSTI